MQLSDSGPLRGKVLSLKQVSWVPATRTPIVGQGSSRRSTITKELRFHPSAPKYVLAVQLLYLQLQQLHFTHRFV